MNPKILLIRPPAKFFINKNKVSGNYPDLGLLYIAAYLERAGKYVEVLDLSLEKNPHEKLIEKINSYKPDTIGISSHTIQFLVTIEYAKIIRETTNYI